MCAIAGFVLSLPAPDAPARLQHMIEVQRHRGPDGVGAYLTVSDPPAGRSTFCAGGAPIRLDSVSSPHGIWDGLALAQQPKAQPQVGLANRRLAIIDRAHGVQPVYNEDHRIVAVMNGELYNHTLLRAWLEARGHRFVAASDTEVLVHLYEEVGIEGLLPRLRGMFALALWDGNSGTLHLARDPLGEKPLHFAHTTSGLYFASELKGLLECSEVSRRLHPDALCQYLLQESVPGAQTMLEGIRRLEPGQRLSYTPAQLHLARWCALDPVQALLEGIPTTLSIPWYAQSTWAGGIAWPPAAPEYDLPDSDGAWLHLLEQTLQRAVGAQLMGEVPVGVLLSGGLDSSLVAAFAAQQHPALHSFSLGFQEQGFDEAPHAARVAEALGLEHTCFRLNAGALETELAHIQQVLDEPLADGSLVPTSMLCRKVREAGVGVALTGDGGDEVLGGYPTYLAARVLPHTVSWQKGGRRMLRDLLEALAEQLPRSFGNLTPDFLLRRVLLGLTEGGARRHALWMCGLEPEALSAVLLPPWRAGLLPERLFAHSDALQPLVERLPWPMASQRIDLARYLPEDLLVKSDRASMAWGLELRAPLLDPDVVGLGLRLPPHLKLKGLKTKVALREIGKRWLPQEILERKKKGFGMPTALWLKSLPEPLVRAWLNPPADQEPIFDPQVVDQWLKEHRSGARDHRKRLWPILMLELWRRGPWGPRA